MKRNRDTALDSRKALISPITAETYHALSPDDQRHYRPVPRKYERLPRVCIVLYGIALCCLVLLIVQSVSVAFSDWFNLYISAPIRGLLAALTAPLPFSLGELIIWLLPLGLGLALYHGIRHRCDTWRASGVFIGILFSIILTVFSLFVLGFSAGYRNTTLDKRLELEQESVSDEELRDTAKYLQQQLNATVSQITFEREGFSVMPWSLDEMNQKLSAAYDSFCATHDFIKDNAGQPKPVLASEALSYLHITGVYSFFTGEANINVNFPDYTIPYTAAHEMAHQRGIAREDEANMIAFLVCLESDDSYIRYSALLNMYEYVANALYDANASMLRSVNSSLDASVRGEMSAYNDFYETYRDSTASKVSGTVNNTYLQSQQVPAGTKSYGMVVDLTVAWCKTRPGLDP